MLRKVDLNPAQIKAFLHALNNEGDGTLTTEISVNLTRGGSFFSVRYLPLPALDGHGLVPGSGCDCRVGLFQGDNGYIILQQNKRKDDPQLQGANTIEANFVLASTLDFMPESRRDDWPLRVRRMRMEVIEWTLEQGKHMPARLKEKFRLWQDIADSTSDCDFFDDAMDGIRKVLAGTHTAWELWGAWTLDKAGAERDFNGCMGLRNVLENLLPARTQARPGP